MRQRIHPRWSVLLGAFLILSACRSNPPTGVETDDIRGTWSGTFSGFALMGRTLSGDADWTFDRESFEIIFFNPPDGQAERIQGKWKFTDGKIALKLQSSFPIDSDVGATDTLFVSILRDEMSLKTISDSSILLIKTRLASLKPTYGVTPFGTETIASTVSKPTCAVPLLEDDYTSEAYRLTFEDLRFSTLTRRPQT